jgi:uncharacterized protein YkwD
MNLASPPRRPQTAALAALLSFFALLPLAAPASAAGSAAAASRGCTGSRVHVTLCRMNKNRRAHRLRPLSLDPLLTRAALAKARDMVARHYFAHVSPTGETMSGRVAQTGWMRGRGSWTIGENLAWGAGSQSTPASLVRAWMHSPPHRSILLSPSYRRVGIGDVPATPFGGGGATLVADFGS